MSNPTKRYDVCAGRPYMTRDGEEKKHWVNIGRGTSWDDGGISIELHSVPVGNWFDGKLNLFEQKPKEDASAARSSKPRGSQSPPRGQTTTGSSSFEDDGDIPFAPAGKRSHFIL